MVRLRFRALHPLVLAGVAACLFCGQKAWTAPIPPQAREADLDPVSRAVEEFYNLQFAAAEQALDAWLSGHPEDLRALSYLARVFMQREMLRREMLEAQAYGDNGAAFRRDAAHPDVPLRQKIFGDLNKLEKAAQTRLEKNPRDADALYWLGAAHVTRAIYYLTLEKSSLQALSEAKEAQKYNVRLLQTDPGCADAYMVIGTYDYVVGSLPWYTKVVAALIGYHGDRSRGLEELQRAAEHGHWARTDAQTFLSILYYREKRYADAIRILENLEHDYPGNFVVPQEIARADKAQNDWQSAARKYDDMIRQYESRSPGIAEFPAAKIYYQAGKVYEHLGENDEALRRFQKAAAIQGNNIYVYRADLAAASIEMKQNRNAEARARYERVARTIPNTGEGRAAAQALKSFAVDSGSR